MSNKLFRNRKKRDYKVGLALGGGGARGFAHIGALKAFEENGIVFDEVAGTSVGSIVASMYAFGVSSDEMLKTALKLKNGDIKSSKVFFVPSKTEGIETLIKSVIGDAHFEDMKKPLTIVAVDLKSTKEIHITQGSVVKACAGSSAVPGIFNPVDFGKYLHADGGLQNNIPADVLRNNGCKYVVSIDINPTRAYGTESTKLIDILEATFRILMKSNSVKGEMYSDVFIKVDTSKFKSTSVEGGAEMYKIGYDAAMQAMPQLKALLDQQKPKFNFWSIFKKKTNKSEITKKSIDNKNENNIKEKNKENINKEKTKENVKK